MSSVEAQMAVSIPLLDFNQAVDGLPATASIRGFYEETDVNIDNLRSIIHQHARDGNLGAVEVLLVKYPDLVNRTDLEKLTALHYAARYGNLNVVQLLIDCGANVNAMGSESQTPLHMVAKYCRSEGHNMCRDALEYYIDVSAHRTCSSFDSKLSNKNSDTTTAIVNLLVDHGAGVSYKDIYGLTPLHYAAMKKNAAAANALVCRQADVNAEDKNEMTPLLTACVHGADSVVQILLDAGADCGHDDNRKNTVYHIAAQHGNVDTLNLLLRYGGKVCRTTLWTENNEGKTALRLAVEGNHPKTMRAILELKMEDERKIEWNNKDKLLLHLASTKGYLDIVKELITFGADIHLRDEDMRLPLHNASRSNQAEVVQYLVDLAPKTIEAQDEYGMTPLLLAASFNALEATKVLLNNNAEIWACDNDGRSVIFIGAKYNALNVLEFLLNMTQEPNRDQTSQVMQRSYRSVLSPNLNMVNLQDHNQNTAMHVVCSNGYLEMCRLLYEHGAEIAIMNEDEEIPLHLAAAYGQASIVRQLLEWDKRLVLHKDEIGNTPLHLAAKYGYDVTTKVLLDAGADMEARNSHEETPLVSAVMAGKLETVQQLVNKGATIENAEDQRSTTPLHLAAEKGFDSIVRFLLLKSATIDRRDKNNRTALDIAIREGHREVARALVEDSNWKNLMRSYQSLPLGRHNHGRDTPLRRLINKFPDVAEHVFDNCVTGCGERSEDYNFFYVYDFEFLDDTYMMPSKNGTELLSTINPFNDDGFLKKGAKAYSDDYDVIYKNHPLKIMVNSERLDLLSHPLAISLLKYKWNSLGRFVYYFALAIYIVFIFLYTIYITQTPAPYNLFDKKNNYIDLDQELADYNGTCKNALVSRPPSLNLSKWAVIILAIAQLLKEAFQLLTRRLRYLSLDNGIECFVYSSAIITVLDLSSCSVETGLRMNWQWLLAAVCAFMAWMNLLLLIRKLPRFGIYVVMFFDILRTFSRFFIIFVLFIIAFSIAFYVIMQNRPEFSTLSSSVLKTTVMMIGEFEFTSIFHGDSSLHPEKLFGHAVAYPIFLFFCIIMTILLMNLLVGLAVDDIKSVQEKAELKRLSMQVDLVLQVETSMPFIRKITCRSYCCFYPNQMTFMKRLRNRFGFDPSMELLTDPKITEKDGGLTTELRRELQSQNSQIHTLQTNIDVMYEKQIQMDSMIRAILRHLKIDYQEMDT